MSHFDGLFFWLGALFLRLGPADGGADPNATSIGTFFGRLTNDLTVFALAMAGFFLRMTEHAFFRLFSN